MPKNLNSRILKGSAWLILLEIFNQLLQFFKTFYAAKFFLPKEFGIIGLALLILATIDTLSTLGLKEALIQKRGQINSYLNTVWTIEVIKGFFIFLLALLIIYIIFPVLKINNFNDYKEVIILISFVFFTQSATNSAILFLEKDILFGRFFIYNIVGTLSDVISTCVLIFLTKSIWSLLIGVLICNVIKLILSFILVNYRPKFQIDKDKFKELFVFGKWIFLNRLIGFLSYQIDSITVASFFPLKQLGLYQMANRVGNLPMNQASNIIGRIIYPTFSKVHINNRLLSRAFVSFLKDINIVILPGLTLAILYLPQLIIFIIGTKWVEILPITRILLLAGLGRIYLSIIDSFYLSIGVPKISTYLQFSRMIIFLIFIYPFMHFMGVIGVSIAFFLSIFIVVCYYTVKVLNRLQLNWSTYLKTFLHPILISILFLLVSIIINYYKFVNSLLSLSIICAIQYILFFSILIALRFKHKIKF